MNCSKEMTNSNDIINFIRDYVPMILFMGQDKKKHSLHKHYPPLKNPFENNKTHITFQIIALKLIWHLNGTQSVLVVSHRPMDVIASKSQSCLF